MEAANEIRFDGHVAIITGGGGGLGCVYARLLAARGARLVVNDVGTDVRGAGASVDPARSVVDEIRASGGVAVASTHSIAAPGGGSAIVEEAISHFGRIDIVVNNAGIMDAATFPDMTIEDLQRQLDVHLVGAFDVTRAAWPHMVDRGYGRIVMTSSSAGLYGMPVQLGYSIAKAGVLGLVRGLAAVGAEHGIKVNGISPAGHTRMTEAGIADEKVIEFSRSSRPPTEVAPVVALLCHPSCAVSGEMLSASGGRVARIFIAETRGYARPRHSPEELLGAWDEVVDESEYVVPRDVAHSIGLNVELLRMAGAMVSEAPAPRFRDPAARDESEPST
jgi:NAD(P)-dependent dehydrogenase (short-subunit alcohol dehydrogenase family)